MDYALETKSKFDAIVVLTGSHNYCDNAKLWQRLKRYYPVYLLSPDFSNSCFTTNGGQWHTIRYRAEVNPLARWVVNACGTTQLSTADPSDRLMFDFAGFDRSVPKMIASFVDERF